MSIHFEPNYHSTFLFSRIILNSNHCILKVYQSRDGKEEKVFDTLEWLAAMCSHVPNKGEQMVRYYGYYSNVSRGKQKMNDQNELK